MDDRLSAKAVEFTVDGTGKVWVNVDGRCALRIGHAAYVETDDNVDGKRCVRDDEAAVR